MKRLVARKDGSSKLVVRKLVAAIVVLGTMVCADASPVRAQSLLGAGGFGLPVEALGARSRGMGSLGMGLSGTALLPGDPAAARDIQIPMITATYQPTWTTYDFQGTERNATASRFPVLGIAYPVGSIGGVATLTLAGVLDQNWEVVQESTLTLESGETLDVLDRFRSSGGVSVIRLGWTQSVTESIGVGLTVGSYLGNLRRTMVRTFTGGNVGDALSSFQEGGEWRLTGPTVVLGASWDPSDLVRVAGSVTWSGEIHAEPTTTGAGAPRDIDIPMEYRLGATGSLSPRLSMNLGATFADWSVATGDLNEGSGVADAWSYGGGLEWDGPQLLGRTFPLRLGARHSDLPFRFEGAEPTEDVIAFGVGLNLLGDPEQPVAAIDFSLETGSREAGSFSESFSRATFTVRVAGG